MRNILLLLIHIFQVRKLRLIESKRHAQGYTVLLLSLTVSLGQDSKMISALYYRGKKLVQLERSKCFGILR